jgi:hypothetical protein
VTTILLILLPIAVVLTIYGLFWKLAARILRYGGVSWPLAFLAAATIFFLSGFVRGVTTVLKLGLPWALALPVSAAISITIGAWCFHDRATGTNGEPVGWPGAFKLSGLALVLFLTPAALVLGYLLLTGQWSGTQ